MRFVISVSDRERKSKIPRRRNCKCVCAYVCVCDTNIHKNTRRTHTPLIVYTIMIREYSIELRKKLKLRQQIDEMCA